MKLRVAAIIKAYIVWLLYVYVDIMVRFLVLACVPIVLIWSCYGLRWSQQSYQSAFSIFDIFMRPWPPLPRIRLLPIRRRRCRDASNNRVVSGDVLPPLDESREPFIGRTL